MSAVNRETIRETPIVYGPLDKIHTSPKSESSSPEHPMKYEIDLKRNILSECVNVRATERTREKEKGKYINRQIER